MLGPRSAGAQHLRRLLSSRRTRREERRYAFEGPTLLANALEGTTVIERVLVSPEGMSDPKVFELIASAAARDITIDHLAPGVLEKVADAASSQSCAAIAEGSLAPLHGAPSGDLVLILDAVQDPGNLGALIRVAEATHCGAVIVTGASADPLGPKALRASAGSSFRLPLFESGSIVETIEQLRKDGVTVYSTSSHGGEDFATMSWAERVALVFGNEGAGLDQTVEAICDQSVLIPLAETVESLNVSVAAGILAMSVDRGLHTSDSGPRGSTIKTMSGDETQ